MTTTVDAFDPRLALRRVGECVAVGAGLGGLYLATGLGIPCPLREATGIWCPACGGTRMLSAGLRGDLVGAFWWNPFAFVVLAVVALCTVAWAVEVAGGPRWRPLARWGGVSQTRLYWVLGAVAAVFMVVRNIPHWPPRIPFVG